MPRRDPASDTRPARKLLFCYIGHPHQVFHSLPIAAEMSLLDPAAHIDIACDTDAQERVARRLAALYPGARLHFRRLELPPLCRLQMSLGIGEVPRKTKVLLHNRDYFAGFDAIVVPERSSLYIKQKLDLPQVKLIWTRHGAGDRSIGYAADAKGFDFVLLAGQKSEQRLLSAGIIRPGHYHVGAYAKLDAVQRLERQKQQRLFDNDRPTVLYNPHFSRGLSSWHPVGREVLDFFAASSEFNLVFAPHIRLFEWSTRRSLNALKQRYAGLPHMLIDPGSDRSIDMSYTMAADIYLGDVSSQVAEFLLRPRPCLFLNPHRLAWQNSPDFLFWQCGPVLDQLADLPRSLRSARADHARSLPAQQEYIRRTFAINDDGQSSAAAAAVAIADYLQRSPVRHHAAGPAAESSIAAGANFGLP